MRYVDGYVLPIPKKHLAAYRKIANMAARVWRDHGALSCRETVGEDLSVPFGIPFPKALQVKRGETVVFSWIEFKSRAHRDRVNAAVMKDPRMNNMGTKMPFDCTRIVYGGFQTIVAR